ITPKNLLAPFIINLKVNGIIEIEELSEKLVQSGYLRVSKVSNFGEFSIRGDIVDIYHSIYKNPVRIDFFDNQIESIKTFNPSTQKSEDNLEAVVIPPHKEIVYGEKEVKKARDILYNLDGETQEKDQIFEKISNYQSFDGEQYYLRLFYDKFCILEYFKDGILVVNDIKSIKKKANLLYNDFKESYSLTAYRRKPRIKPNDMLHRLEDLYFFVNQVIECNFLEDIKNPYDFIFNFKGIPVYLGNLELFKKDTLKFLDQGYRIILFANTIIQAERLQSIFTQFEPGGDRFDFKEKGFSILPLFLSDGFISEEEKIIFLNDYEIFGRRKKITKHFYTKRTEVIDSFIDLKPGDYVVHINHGIGQFMGIERVKSLGIEKDYISILYADDDKIFIPVEQLNFIQKYISQEFSKPKLDRIGSKGWSKTKERVRRSIEELAKELIKLYSFRLKQKGFAFMPDTTWQKEFEAKFPYEETEDQLLTIEEVKRDMEQAKPMDRLICGDVGFGKTEIAIRAAFKSVMSGKQAIILVPTTILAEQHYETFYERLGDYPINVEMLSRFRSAKEQNQIIDDLKNGEVDIIIGTHRLLSKDIEFKNPGLFIIDEEQRFGVKHKEKLKQIKKSIDSLSLTATPIPRTLHMSLSNIRNISIINTPPKDRQSVETYVMEFNEEILVEAIKRELDRDGQIFFLYNRIKTIYTMKSYLEKLIPRARIIVAHGRLHEDELEDVIHSFIQHEYDILLTTTIIESGI
ncbi:MAG: DEAD/DEAH box helicase, partial [Spirochaetes bacterium]|nr:DEAD/DEAH box helicase [Spirochaetota bacterium]